MFLDMLLNMATDGMSGMMAALPSWVPQIDTTEINKLLTTISAWNNWLPLDQLAIVMGLAVGLWIALQALAAVLKTVDTVKP